MNDPRVYKLREGRISKKKENFGKGADLLCLVCVKYPTMYYDYL